MTSLADRPRQSAPRPRSRAREIAVIVVLALALSWVLKSFVVQSFYIPSESMQTTLEVGDRILVNKLPFAGDVHRGDIIVFEDPGGWGGEQAAPRTGVRGVLATAFEAVGLAPVAKGHLVKRVIGVGGDHIVCCGPDGRLSVNGQPLDEPYLNPDGPPSDDRFDVTVPAGKLWVMGDHRSVSEDSRAHLDEGSGGMVDADLVVGRVVVVVWPFRHLGTPD